MEERPRGAGLGRLRRLPHLGGPDGNRSPAPAWRGDDVLPERGHGHDHAGRAPDLRAGSRARLPEGTARAGPQRMALDANPGNEEGAAGHSQGQEVHPMTTTWFATRGTSSRRPSVTNPKINTPSKGTTMSIKVTLKRILVAAAALAALGVALPATAQADTQIVRLQGGGLRFL